MFFESILALKVVLSNINEVKVAILKVKSENICPKIMQHGAFGNFDNANIHEILHVRLSNIDMNSLELGNLKKKSWSF